MQTLVCTATASGSGTPAGRITTVVIVAAVRSYVNPAFTETARRGHTPDRPDPSHAHVHCHRLAQLAFPINIDRNSSTMVPGTRLSISVSIAYILHIARYLIDTIDIDMIRSNVHSYYR